MTREEAIKASIKKWEANTRIKSMEEADLSPKTCALCVEYRQPYDPVSKDWVGWCRRCPVFAKTGRECCAETPYDDCADIANKYSTGYITERMALHRFKLAAKREVKFLQGLKP